jgi:2-methylisocitrate lyase-like PEP mutase family enzyme
MSQAQKAEDFAKLHVKGSPIRLYNAWDAGSAKAVFEAGAKAIATSSWAVAEAHGYRDGETIPLNFVEQVIGRIIATIDAPVTVDFEGGYSDDDKILKKNIGRLIDLGAIGINFEDRIVQGKGLYSADIQARRIAAIREIAESKGVKFFINARSDVFFQGGDPDGFVDEALARGAQYTSAGASGIFLPGLKEEKIIERLCDAFSLPVNLLAADKEAANKRFAELGVARISWGAAPHIEAMKSVKKAVADRHAV